MDNKREKLGSRLGFILLSAGCAIGCGNVWKFPWMTGQFGGGGFVLIYLLCLILLGLPAMTMEFAVGRAAQASPVKMQGCLVCGAGIFLIALTTALGYSVLHFQPFAEGTAWLDFWDFIVSTNLLPIGALVFALFCCWDFGWGWKRFMAEANEGKGLKIQNWMRPLFQYFVPLCVLVLYIYGLVHFQWR